jgi:hypothetical protein
MMDSISWGKAVVAYKGITETIITFVNLNNGFLPLSRGDSIFKIIEWNMSGRMLEFHEEMSLASRLHITLIYINLVNSHMFS